MYILRAAEFLIRQKKTMPYKARCAVRVHVHRMYTIVIHGSGALWWCIIKLGVKKPYQLKAPSLFLDKDKVSQG